MRIGLILYDPQEAGGLEEYAVTLAIGLRDLGHEVSAVSATWVAPGNQYVARLRANHVPVFQPPAWLSRPASHWPTKERLLALLVTLLAPLVAVLAVPHYIVVRGSFAASLASARRWLRGRLAVFIAPDRRASLGRLVLGWWRLRCRPDVLHVQGYTSTLLFAVAWGHARGLPVVYEEHQTPDSRFDWWRDFGAAVNRANIVVAVSEESKRALQTMCGITRPIVARAPLLPDPLAAGWRRSAAPSAREGLRVTTLARLAVTKGLEYLLDAIVLVQQVHPSTRFRVYGEGPLREELLARAKALGLDGELIFRGAFTSREELAAIMAETDVVAMSSVLEGQPLALVEAMAYGCPIVTTSVGGIPELIQDRVNGLLCPPRDPAALAHALVTVIEDETLRMRLGQRARRSYEDSAFQPRSVCAHLASIYARAVTESRASRPS